MSHPEGRPAPVWTRAVRSRGIWALPVLVVGALLVVMLYRTPAPDERIVMEVVHNGKYQLYAMRPDGSGMRALVKADAWQAPVSADGSHIALVTREGLYVMSADGTGKRRVAGPGAGSPSFSADGKKMAFVVGEYGATKIHIISTDDKGAALTPDGGLAGEEPVLSPDGSQIAFSANDTERSDLYVASSTGAHLRCLSRGECSEPAFSPDGKTIAFTASLGSDLSSSVYLVDSDGAHRRRLTTDPVVSTEPIFSPDGTQILFKGSSADSPVEELYVVDIDGTNLRRLTSDGSGVIRLGAAFSPDGKYVAFSTSAGVFRVPTNNGVTRLLTDKGGGQLYWGPLGADLGESSSRVEGRLAHLPAGYETDEAISADLDGDGTDEQASVSSPPSPPGANQVPKLLTVSRGNETIWRLECTDFTAVEHLGARDLTGDGRPELLFDFVTYGAGSGTAIFHALRNDGEKFRTVIGTEDGTLAHSLEGGLLIKDGGQGRPSTLVLYDFLWAEDEARSDAHRYCVEWYAMKSGQFVCIDSRETKRRYKSGNPPGEFGLFTETSSATISGHES